jgi:hypothetical protein
VEGAAGGHQLCAGARAVPPALRQHVGGQARGAP